MKKYNHILEGRDLFDLSVFSEYYKKYQSTKDQKLKDKLIAAHLGLVDNIAKEYYNKGDLDYDDLVGYGRIGLIEGFNRFNPDIAGFTTYASYWINQEIIRAIIHNGSTIRISAHVIAKMRRLEEEKNDYIKKFNKIPTRAELANYTGKSLEKISKYLDISERYNVLSLDSLFDSPFEDEEEGDNFIEDPKYINEIDDLLDKINSDKLLEKVQLTIKEREILSKRFGLYGYSNMTLEDIGNDYDLSRERIRQITNKAIRKIRTQIDYDSEKRSLLELENKV
jgi:RNA polymerase nonessential primary-like sigma factor